MNISSVGVELVHENREIYTNGRIDIAKPIVAFRKCVKALIKNWRLPAKQKLLNLRVWWEMNSRTGYREHSQDLEKKLDFTNILTFLPSFIQLLRNALIFIRKLKIFTLFCMRGKFGVSCYLEEPTLWLYWCVKKLRRKTKGEPIYGGNFIDIALKQINVNWIPWKHKENSNIKRDHVSAAPCRCWAYPTPGATCIEASPLAAPQANVIKSWRGALFTESTSRIPSPASHDTPEAMHVTPNN
jgi:hypothetical protein